MESSQFLQSQSTSSAWSHYASYPPEPEIVDMLVATMRGRGADRAVSVLKAGLTAHRVDPVAVDRELHGAHCALLVAPDPREMSCTAGCGRGDRGTLLVVDQRNDDVRWRTIDDPSVIQRALKHQLDVALQRIRPTPELGMAPDRRWFLELVAPLKESHDRGVGNTDDPRRLLTYERIERLAVLATLLLPDTDLDVIAAVFDQRTSVARGNADRCLANIEVTGILWGGQKVVNLRLLSPRNPNNSQLWRY